MFIVTKLARIYQFQILYWTTYFQLEELSNGLIFRVTFFLPDAA